MTNPITWANLPNAKHIDRILADVKARPDVWTAALDDAWDAARDAALVAARDAARGAARGVAWGALYALIAWDESVTLLTLTPDALRILMHTAPELMNHQAVLLLPAVIALNGDAHD